MAPPSGSAIDMTGETRGRVLVLRRDGVDWGGYPMWLCRCTVCNVIRRIRGCALRQNPPKTCTGCRREQARHGLTGAAG